MASIRNRNGKWQAQVRRHGHKALTKSFTNKSDAQKWARGIETNIDNGTIDLQGREMLNTPLSKYLTRYLLEISPHKTSHNVEKYILKNWLNSSLAKYPIGSITPSHIQAELEANRAHWKPSTIQRNFGVLRHVFNTAQTLWEAPLRRNPVAGVKLPTASEIPIRRVPEGFWRALDNHPQDKVYWVIQFAVETAMRRGEIANLKWSDIDRCQQFVTISKTKTNRIRHIPLSKKAIKILETRQSQSETVFNMSPNAIKLAWQRKKKIIRFEGVRFHDLRHEAISRLFERGLTIPEVASISGHSTPTMLFRYAHSDIRRLIEKMSDYNGINN
ncbi:MAG: tyrosine-type recombinase/integrase [Parvibaculales bacterium]